jgi:hypothetical protein
MDEELKQYLEGMEGRIVDRVTERVTDRVTERVTDRVAELVTDRVTERVTERVGGRIDAVEERMKDYVRQSNHDLETKIIIEFHKWGRTSDMRTKQAITDTGLLGERMLAVEDRVAALERERRG